MADYPYSVHVIESPSATDLLDRRQEREALHRSLRHTGVGIEDYLVVNRQALANALVRIVRRPEIASARHTVIHLSTHGSPDGLELTSGEVLDWPQLGEALRYVNEAVSGRLLLCLSACHGLHALKMVAPQADLPFGTLVGPTHEVVWVDSIIAFLAFYHVLVFKELQPDEAVRTMNVAAGLPEGFFVAVDGKRVRRRIATPARDRRLRSLRDLLLKDTASPRPRARR
jgi:hypothetical protein